MSAIWWQKLDIGYTNYNTIVSARRCRFKVKMDNVLIPLFKDIKWCNSIFSNIYHYIKQILLYRSMYRLSIVGLSIYTAISTSIYPAKEQHQLTFYLYYAGTYQTHPGMFPATDENFLRTQCRKDNTYQRISTFSIEASVFMHILSKGAM